MRKGEVRDAKKQGEIQSREERLLTDAVRLTRNVSRLTVYGHPLKKGLACQGGTAINVHPELAVVGRGRKSYIRPQAVCNCPGCGNRFLIATNFASWQWVAENPAFR